MKQLKLNRFKIKIETTDDEYGFNCKFNNGLNILRGNNSSGKSTFIQALIYSLGMEELLGAKDERVLPYALKTYLENNSKDNTRIEILHSYVFIELENGEETVTFKRAIKSDNKDTKLIEVIRGAYLTNTNDSKYEIIPTFLHDSGAAQNSEHGFFAFFEKFLDLNLPHVDGTKGKQVKLYLQTIFSAFLIEQKRGWTDYIATTPYYTISSVKTKIVQYILNLDVFESKNKRKEIQNKIIELEKQWLTETIKISTLTKSNNLFVKGITKNIDDSFDIKLVNIYNIESDGSHISSDTYESELVEKITQIENKINQKKPDLTNEVLVKLEEAKEKIDIITFNLEHTLNTKKIKQSSLKELVTLLNDINADITKNNIAQKLKKLGAESNITIANDICPTCNQPCDDTLLKDNNAYAMSIDENLEYLKKQKKMLEKSLASTEYEVNNLDNRYKCLNNEYDNQKNHYSDIKRQIRLKSEASEIDLKIKIRHEIKLEDLHKNQKSIKQSLELLSSISHEFNSEKSNLEDIPIDKQSPQDFKKIQTFEKQLQSLITNFGYGSIKDINQIKVHLDTLVPYFEDIELKQINTSNTQADVKHDSSASDFVRLIWSYLLALYNTSNEYHGNHIGLIVFDEPAQHSMSNTSLNELFKQLSNNQNLQSLIAASFNNSDGDFTESTQDIKFNLIQYGDKLLEKFSK